MIEPIGRHVGDLMEVHEHVSDGGRLYWEHAGRGPVIVLIHAGLWDRRIWDAQMEPFAESHRVVRYDLRGFGRSSPLEQPFSAREDLAGLLGALL